MKISKDEDFVRSVAKFQNIISVTFEGFQWTVLEVKVFNHELGNLQFTGTSEANVWRQAAKFIQEALLKKFGNNAS